MSAKEFGVLLALGAIWGASFMFIKVGGAEIQPFFLVEMRLGLAALVMLAIVARQRGALSGLIRHWRPLLVMGVLNCALPYTLLTWGETYISSGLAAILNACAPLWSALLGFVWVWAERLAPSRLLGVLVGFGGVVLVVSANLSGGEEGIMQFVAQGAVLTMALSYAVAGVYGRKALKGVQPIIPAAGQLITGALVLMPLAAFQVPQVVPSWQALGAVITLAILGTALASLLFYWLLARVGTTKTLLVTYLLPIFALLWGALFLREEVTLPAVVGLALVLLGITITSGRGAPIVVWLRNKTRGATALF
ncbi:MAG TPA: DMT family transporter [Chloroflexia bacterium]|nr:DMT family transporter [Chloroflexia bacterium]